MKYLIILQILLLGATATFSQSKLDKDMFRCEESVGIIYDNFRNKFDSLYFNIGSIILMKFDSVSFENEFCESENEYLKIVKYKNEILFEFNKENGKVNGVGFCYYPFYKKTAMIGEFKNGRLHGKLQVFNKEGVLIEIMIYKRGRYKKHTYHWQEAYEQTKKFPVKYKGNPLLNQETIVR